MASVNKAIIVGNLGKDPEIRDANETVVANLSIATTRKFRRGDDVVEETEWHRVVFFGRLGEICQQYLKKGSAVYVEGRIRTRKYEKDGVDRYTTEIVGEQLQMLGSRASDGEAPKPAAPKKASPKPQAIDESEDVPF